MPVCSLHQSLMCASIHIMVMRALPDLAFAVVHLLPD